MKLNLGKKIKINDVKDKRKKTVMPKYYKMHEIKTQMPGASVLHLEVWQYSLLSRNKKIGETKIDLEDRYFSSKFRSL